MRYTINYEYGTAKLFTPSEDWKSRFFELAEQCFGIRNSIGEVELIDSTNKTPHRMMDGEYERLCHNGDVIIWNDKGEKIKSEWDFGFDYVSKEDTK